MARGDYASAKRLGNGALAFQLCRSHWCLCVLLLCVSVYPSVSTPGGGPPRCIITGEAVTLTTTMNQAVERFTLLSVTIDFQRCIIFFYPHIPVCFFCFVYNKYNYYNNNNYH